MYNDIIQRGVARGFKGGWWVYMGVSQDIKEGGVTGHQRRGSHRTSKKEVSKKEVSQDIFHLTKNKYDKIKNIKSHSQHHV
jgi:hypothetical protein